jgi:DNA-binding transcriptional MerR regulator
MDDGTMHIGELADRTGLSQRTIRHYEEVGILTPTSRTDAGYRVYTASDEQRLLLIRRMKPLGYSLEQMKALLDVVDALDARPDDPALLAQFELIRDEAVERRELLRSQLSSAEEFVDRLQGR